MSSSSFKLLLTCSSFSIRRPSSFSSSSRCEAKSRDVVLLSRAVEGGLLQLKLREKNEECMYFGKVQPCNPCSSRPMEKDTRICNDKGLLFTVTSSTTFNTRR